MTGAQKRWLDAHREYEPVGRAGGKVVWTRQASLTVDGVLGARMTERLRSDGSHPMPNDGAILVGVRENREVTTEKRSIDMSQYPPAWGVGNSGVKVV
jgi:hypothetical protein